MYVSTLPEVPFYALSRHADVWTAWRDPARYSNSHGVSLELWSPQARRRSSFISMDPPEHTAFRALISRGFSPRRVAELEPRIRELTRARLSTAVEMGGFDFITDLVQRIPVDVISELIGVPEADRDQVLAWSNLLVQRDEDFTMPHSAIEATLHLVGYYTDLIAERRRRPGEDLVSALLAAEIDGARLSEADICAVLLLLGAAGNESTTKLLGNAWYQAARHPGQRALAFAGAIEAWIEETLRYDSSGQMVARLVTADVTWYGQRVPAGSRMLLLGAAANRDPRVFPDPERFDLTRDTGDLLSFGTGPHFCLGAALARLESRVVLEELVAAVREDYEIGTPVRMHSPNIRGFAALPTVVEPR
ncbi:cytochrome P450 [Planobispora takensis]|uniref:Putative cytochrome P450 123 n=1 Tax=Planobispora takensis TaxID=1367882 RepID=A0A8J3T2K8_9ACTN|nr:cytochrome P450 [Planobispora takensis]GII04101.1 putative cytochrome P450 123 [Planobispora takensis]